MITHLTQSNFFTALPSDEWKVSDFPTDFKVNRLWQAKSEAMFVSLLACLIINPEGKERKTENAFRSFEKKSILAEEVIGKAEPFPLISGQSPEKFQKSRKVSD